MKMFDQILTAPGARSPGTLMRTVPKREDVLSYLLMGKPLVAAIRHDDEIPPDSKGHDVADLGEIRLVQAPVHGTAQEDELANLDVMARQHRDVGAVTVREEIELGLAMSAHPRREVLHGF